MPRLVSTQEDSLTRGVVTIMRQGLLIGSCFVLFAACANQTSRTGGESSGVQSRGPQRSDGELTLGKRALEAGDLKIAKQACLEAMVNALLLLRTRQLT